jgi:hypothetical protein
MPTPAADDKVKACLVASIKVFASITPPVSKATNAEFASPDFSKPKVAMRGVFLLSILRWKMTWCLYLTDFRERMLPSHKRALANILACRTESMGGHLCECNTCGHQHYSYHSCKNRSCPKCHANDTKRWLEKREAELLPVRYFHVVFTLPQELRDNMRSNQRKLYSILMQAASEMLMKLALDPKHVGGKLSILKDADTGKRLGIFTNNVTKPLYDIAWYMLQRWGKSENVFKELMARFNLNYHPGYDIKELEKQPLVDNPDIVLTKQAIQALKKETVRLDKEILYAEALLPPNAGKKLQDDLTKLRTKREVAKEEAIAFEEKLAQLPDKVSIVELLHGKQMSRCDLEKKKLYDIMQMMAYHSRERLVEIFRECYSDRRDIKKVLDMITTKSGIVKLVGQTLMVILSGIENKKHRQAAIKLCQKLNEKRVTMNGSLNLKLFFHLADIP